jgi:hypothetical protein
MSANLEAIGPVLGISFGHKVRAQSAIPRLI